MDDVSAMLLEQEILSWWSTERGRVDRECREAAELIKNRAVASAEDLNIRKLVLSTKARREILRRVESDINVFNQKLARSLDDSIHLSIERLEGTGMERQAGTAEFGLLVGSGVGAAGAVGTAVAASSLAAATSATFFGFLVVPLASFSWPVFAGGAALAIGAAVIAPKLTGSAEKRLERKFKAYLIDNIDAWLLGFSRSDQPSATRQVMFQALDQARDARLNKVKK